MATDVNKFDKQMKAVSNYATFLLWAGYVALLLSFGLFILWAFVTPAGDAERVEHVQSWIQRSEWILFVLGVFFIALSHALRCLYWISMNSAKSSTPAGE